VEHGVWSFDSVLRTIHVRDPIVHPPIAIMSRDKMKATNSKIRGVDMLLQSMIKGISFKGKITVT
jgi:hypothetical protein